MYCIYIQHIYIYVLYHLQFTLIAITVLYQILPLLYLKTLIWLHCITRQKYFLTSKKPKYMVPCVWQCIRTLRQRCCIKICDALILLMLMSTNPTEGFKKLIRTCHAFQQSTQSVKPKFKTVYHQL